MTRSGGGKTKESVYITVESLGVAQAAEQLKGIMGPLQELANALTQISESQKGLSKLSSDIAKTATTSGKVASGVTSTLAKGLKTTEVASQKSSQAVQSLADKINLLPGVVGKSAQGLVGGKGLVDALSSGTTATLLQDGAVKGLMSSLGGLSGVTKVAVGTTAALAVAVGSLVSKGQECIDAYDKLYPEAETVLDVWRATTQEAQILSVAMDSMAGESINELLLPAAKELSAAWLDNKTGMSQFLALLSSQETDKAFEHFGAGFAKIDATARGTFAMLLKNIGINTQAVNDVLSETAEQAYSAGVKRDQTFAGSSAAETQAKHIQRAREHWHRRPRVRAASPKAQKRRSKSTIRSPIYLPTGR